MSKPNARFDAWIAKWELKVGKPIEPAKVAELDLADYVALLQSVADRTARALEGNQILTVVTDKE